MSAPFSIVLTDVAWSTPDGRPVVSDLSLGFAPERTGLVGRNGVGKTTLVKLITGELQPKAGAVAVSGRLGVLRQTLQVDPRETVADLFGASEDIRRLARAAAGEATEDDLARADWTIGVRMASALALVGLEAAPDMPLAALSGGQRTRAALAALVFDEPDMLILDEPTNNLDAEGRAAVADLLRGWRGGAIVVSHDRTLLEAMDAVVELTSLGARRYGGGWSFYREQKSLELAAAHADMADAEKRLDQLARRAQTAVERKARKDAGGRRKAARGDMPKIVLGGMKDRSEDTGGALDRLADRRRGEALSAAAGARERIEVLQPMTVSLPSTGLSSGREVLRLEAVTAGYASGEPVLRDLDFAIRGPERIAVTGPNGSGKTTLIAVAAGTLAPWQGEAKRLTPIALLDQRVSLMEPRASVRDNFLQLNPTSNENACRASLARFKFRAEAALQTAGSLSGGELLRAGLACVLGVAPPPLLLLDEPTNHLDIDSIEAVEAGLRAYDGAFVVVSHDEAFLEAIGVTRRVEL